jgi:6,7-dimethyl-8-ribityllumazine synthase
MAEIIEGSYSAAGLRFGLVVGRFNEVVTSKLLEGALDCLRRHGASEDALTVVWVPGSFEIPLAADRLIARGGVDAVVCLGTVIRGATSHFDYVAGEAAKGIAQVGLKTGVPMLFGVLTTDTLEQAIERAGSKAGNKGWEAALGAIEMANVCRRLDQLGS